MIKEKLERVRDRIAQAARSAGRDPAGVTLVCVTKGVPVDRIQEAIACGVTEIGENRVQEAQGKWISLRYDVPKAPSVRRTDLKWHLIGHLQRNKAKLAVELFDWIHSVDSTELVEMLERQAAERKPGRPLLKVLIEVNVSGEATKHGCRPEETRGLAEAIQKGEHLEWKGLMTMAPFSEDPEASRPVFRRLRELRDALERELGVRLDLSMGMSQDYEVAVQEGATLVRVGTAVFGEGK